ncbi:MAG: deoxyhypusine synthase family protein [Lentisphaerae bacterium]|nr:deoxyhypusine synthase family protein [Lentisphaerota bacterium]
MNRTETPGEPPVSAFIKRHFRHFNAAALREAAEGYCRHLSGNGRMLVTLGGAMSTAELGLSLAEMIRRDKVHAVCCTGANLEEDIFNLVAHRHYERLPGYRDLTPEDEQALLERHMNRVTDTCIPEEEAMRRVERPLIASWKGAASAGRRLFPHEHIYAILREGALEPFYQIDPRDSWVLAACDKNLPLFVPGWEDSTLGNMYAAQCMRRSADEPSAVRGGIEYMTALAEWYRRESAEHGIGFFQIGGGISGDFPICVVPMLEQDLRVKNVRKWAYFCQISEAKTSYGSYSGAVPNEKITWGKLAVDTPRFVIESDASLVAPLVFAYVLGW